MVECKAGKFVRSHLELTGVAPVRVRRSRAATACVPDFFHVVEVLFNAGEVGKRFDDFVHTRIKIGTKEEPWTV